MAERALVAQPRTILGKAVKRLRRAGITPVNLYGPGLPSQPLQVETRALLQALAGATPTTRFHLTVDGQEHITLIKQVDRHPITGEVRHVDFYAIEQAGKVRVAVPLRFVGEAPAVQRGEGVLVHYLETVELEGRPTDLPEVIAVDLTRLDRAPSVIHAGDLPLPPGVRLVTDPTAPVVTVEPPPAAAAIEEAPEEAPSPAEQARLHV